MIFFDYEENFSFVNTATQTTKVVFCFENHFPYRQQRQRHCLCFLSARLFCFYRQFRKYIDYQSQNRHLWLLYLIKIKNEVNEVCFLYTYNILLLRLFCYVNEVEMRLVSTLCPIVSSWLKNPRKSCY